MFVNVVLLLHWMNSISLIYATVIERRTTNDVVHQNSNNTLYERESVIQSEKQMPTLHTDNPIEQAQGISIESPVQNSPELTLRQTRKKENQHTPSKVKKKQKQHPKRKSSSDTALRFVKIEVGDAIHLRCRIPIGPYLVVWNKIGMDYPLTIGTRRFSPDSRIQVRFRQPDKWRLSIARARLTDSGVYTCTTSSNNQTQKSLDSDVTQDDSRGRTAVGEGKEDARGPTVLSDAARGWVDHSGSRKGNSDYYVTIVEPDPTDRFQVDAPASDRQRKRNKTITVTGPKIVFYGTSLELICRASFPNAEAKSNPKISLEWYHRGVRRRPSATRSGGVYIWERWLDSDLLESRLLVAWASEADAGQWICLDRSNLQTSPSQNGFIPQQGMRSTTTTNPSNVFGRYSGSNQINLSPVNTATNRQRQSAIRYNTDELAFDRIEVEIVDLPDPTEMYHTTTQNSIEQDNSDMYRVEPMPTFTAMNDDPRATRNRASNLQALAGTRSGTSGHTWVIRPSRRSGQSSNSCYYATLIFCLAAVHIV